MAIKGTIGEGVVKLKVDFAGLRRDLRTARSEISKLGAMSIKLRLDTRGIKSQLASIGLGKNTTIALRLDLQRFNADLRQAGTMLYRFRNVVSQPIPLRLDASNAYNVMRRLRQDMGRGHTMNVNARGGGGGYSRSAVAAAGLGGGFIGNEVASMGASMGRRAIGAAAAAPALAVGGTLALGVRENAKVEDYRMSLEKLLKSQEKANKLFKELQRIDLDLPVDIGTLAENAQKLVGAGFEATRIGEMLVTIMDAASVSSVGVAEGTSRFVRALSQMRAEGKFNLQDINQMSELGIPVRQIIKEEFGMSAQEVGKATGSGAMDLDTAINKLLAGLEKRYGGTLEARSETFSGLLDQLMDRFRAFSRELSEPLFDDFKKGLKGVVEWMKSEDFRGVTAGSQAAVEGGTNLVEGIGTQLVGTLSGGMKPSEIIEAAGTGLNYVGTLYNEAVEGQFDDGTGNTDKTKQNRRARQILSAPLRRGIAGTEEQQGGMEGVVRSMAVRLYDNVFGLIDEEAEARADAEKAAKDRAEAEKAALAEANKGSLAATTAGLLGAPTGGLGIGGIASLGKGIAESGRNALGGFMGRNGLSVGGMMNTLGKMADAAPGVAGQMALEERMKAEREASDAAARAEAERRNSRISQGISAPAGAGGNNERQFATEALKGLGLNEDQISSILSGDVSLNSRMVRGKDGKLQQEFGIDSMKEGPGAAQFADFSNLNKMLQGQLDQQRMAKHAEDTAKAARELVEAMNKSNKTQEEILAAQDAKPVVIGQG